MFWHNLFEFLRNAYSETGIASSGRLLSTILALVSSGILITVFVHVVGISDIKILGVWLASIPVVIVSLIAFFISPYAVTKGSASLKDLLDFLKGRNNG